MLFVHYAIAKDFFFFTRRREEEWRHVLRSNTLSTHSPAGGSAAMKTWEFRDKARAGRTTGYIVVALPEKQCTNLRLTCTGRLS
jgi:hypothetical protein